jgi:adenosyl cobinamide kinase/adenosyl cobinamide phosphate guanylyltransferase
MITLVLGGARSGKSEVAERLAAALAGDGGVVYLATGEPTDDDMAARIAAHRDRRPPEWRTVEVGGDLVDALRREDGGGVALVDSLGTWVAAHTDLEIDADALCSALATRPGPTVVVSEEVGLGVHPPTAIGRRFRDVLGDLNRDVAAVAVDVQLVVAGRVLHL